MVPRRNMTFGDSRAPQAPETPARALLIKAHKESAKSRWSDHFLLQLRAHGFVVLDPGVLPTEALSRNPRLVAREFRFHPERLWRFDFAVPAHKLAIEIEGGIWMRAPGGGGGGAHSRPLNIQRDVEKGNAATLLGWHLFRFTDKEIRSGESIRLTLALLSR